MIEIEKASGSVTSTFGGGNRNWGARAGEVIAGRLKRGSSGKFESAAGQAISDGLNELGIGKAELDALQAFNKGGELSPDQAQKLASLGLVKANPDGTYSTAAGSKSLLAAIRKGDLAKVRDFINAAKNKPGQKAPKGGKGGGKGDTEAKRTQQRLDNMKKVADQLKKSGLDDFDELVKYAGGDEANPDALDRLVKSGLLERGIDGMARMTRNGNAVLSAAERGDVRKALDSYSLAREEVSKKLGQVAASMRRSRNLSRKEATCEMMDDEIVFSEPVSFAEYESVKNAEKTAEEIHELVGLFESLSRNIMNDSAVDDKVSALQSLTAEFQDRLELMVMVEKAAWDTEYINDLPDSAFLYIAPGGKKDDSGKTVPRTLRNLPIYDASGELDLPHLRNAIARIPLTEAEGMNDKMRMRLQERARKMLQEAQGKKELNALEKLTEFFKSIFSPEEKACGKRHVMPMDSETKESCLKMMGEKKFSDYGAKEIEDGVEFDSEDGMVAFVKMLDEYKASCKKEVDPGTFAVWKEGGVWRWLAAYSNNLRDRDNPPEIISKEAHLEFINAVESGEAEYPELWHWHMKGSAWGKADFIACDEIDGSDVVVTLASGYIYPGHEKEALALSEMDDIRVSHGMNSVGRDGDDKSIIKRYRTIEISDLPGWAAANEFTSFNIEKNKEVEMIPDQKKEYLKRVGLNESRIAEIELKNKAMADMAVDAGIETKESTEVPVEGQAEIETITRKEIADAIAEVVKPMLEITKQQADQISTLFGKIAEFEKAEKERQAEIQAEIPRASISTMVYNRVIGSKEAQIDKRSDLSKEGPQETTPTSGGNKMFWQQWTDPATK